MESSLADGTLRLALRNETMSLYGITSYIDIHHFRPALDPFADVNRTDLLPQFRIEAVAPNVEIHHQHLARPIKFEPIDAAPQLADMETFYLNDMCPFVKVGRGGEEVLIDRADMTVIEHLEAIKNLQSPAQAEIRQRMLETPVEKRDVSEPVSNVVVSLIEYRKGRG